MDAPASRPVPPGEWHVAIMWWWPDKSGTRELPYVYEHSITIAAPRSRVGSALQRYTAISLRIPEGSPIARVPGTQPRAGFEVRTARRPIA